MNILPEQIGQNSPQPDSFDLLTTRARIFLLRKKKRKKAGMSGKSRKKQNLNFPKKEFFSIFL